jgi:hypothetical protein
METILIIPGTPYADVAAPKTKSRGKSLRVKPRTGAAPWAEKSSSNREKKTVEAIGANQKLPLAVLTRIAQTYVCFRGDKAGVGLVWLCSAFDIGAYASFI